MDKRTLFRKAKRVLREEGVGMLARKTSLYLKNYIGGQRLYSDMEIVKNCYSDILFINGCYLSHPSRYRVAHQREQLNAGGISTAEIFYTELSLDYVKNFRAFIFFRCPYTELIGEFVQKAKQYNKIVLFDIDDLVIDTKYTSNIKYVQSMPVQDRKVYDDGVKAIGKLLSMCDGAITTTEAMAEELKHYVSDVMINRNTASEKMVQLSEIAWKQRTVKKDTVTIGYFSGSITHNPDFLMILPAIERLLEKYSYVNLMLVGEIDLPSSLKSFSNQIKVVKMCDWQKLPELISSVDINIAPLEDTTFNRAKSENKWVEAALVRVPTIASDVGAFHHMIIPEETGILCENYDDIWYQNLERLILSPDIRRMIAEKAYRYALNHCTTVYTASAFSNALYKKMTTNIAFLLPVMQISGGALVVQKHACILQDCGYDVTVMHYGYEKTSELQYDEHVFPVISLKDIQVRAVIENCVATLWSTCEFFENYGKIANLFYLVQNYETDFYEVGEPLRLRANQTYCSHMPIKFITISKWCQRWLLDKYGKTAQYAPNGLDVERFYPIERDFSGKIKILIEGNSDDYYKNVDESFQITNQLDPEHFEIWFMSYQGTPKEWYRVDRFLHKVPYENVPEIYRECHILIKSSILESFSYPPLEMMATGGCVVVAPNGGNVEYLEDGYNCLFYHPGNIKDAILKINLILKDREIRERLIENGIQTGRKRAWNIVQDEILRLYQKEI